jgi:uncharacterized protein (DUF362 family)/NAD-dependent dihydropyrimidine dehydrogenase PreA subunit
VGQDGHAEPPDADALSGAAPGVKQTPVDRSTVALVRCPGYDPDEVYRALRRGVELLGGLDRFVRSGERILLKPNILAGEPPEKAVTTHPSVLAGCMRLFGEGGATLRFGDSPGREPPAQAARLSGLERAGIESGAALADFDAARSLGNPMGRFGASFPVARAVHESDGLVNLAKLKSHQLTRLTGAVKNLYGCIPGKRKMLYHVRYQDVHEFCGLLAELNLCLPARLHVLDAVVAMEGNGPRSGEPVAVGALLLSDDPVAVDATFCRLIDLDPEILPTTTAGSRAGLGHYREADIEVVGDPIEALLAPQFKMIRKPVYSNTSYAHFNFIKKQVLARPVIDPARCVRCGHCVDACPVPGKALRFDRGRGQPPVYHYERCIRCYCCHEMCPQRAIDTQTPLLGRILGTA